MQIEVEFLGGLSDEQKKAFNGASKRWMEIITGELSPVTIDDDKVTTGVVISAQGSRIDGAGGVLGRAGPTEVRIQSGLPFRGRMEFDTGDLQRMQDDGTLQDVILHEMGHVLGLGTLWDRFKLLKGQGTDNPEYTGKNAMREYSKLLGSKKELAIPVANQGGPGRREGHWRESVFDQELMTGLAEPANMPISRMTIAALEDLGYEVNYSKADPYKIPGGTAVTGLETQAVTAESRKLCQVDFPDVFEGTRRRSYCCLCASEYAAK